MNMATWEESDGEIDYYLYIEQLEVLNNLEKNLHIIAIILHEILKRRILYDRDTA